MRDMSILFASGACDDSLPPAGLQNGDLLGRYPGTARKRWRGDLTMAGRSDEGPGPAAPVRLLAGCVAGQPVNRRRAASEFGMVSVTGRSGPMSRLSFAAPLHWQLRPSSGLSYILRSL